MLTNSVSCKWCGHDGATLAANAYHYIVDKPHPTHPAVLVVVVVRRHVESPFELTAQEWADLARSLPWPAPVWRGTNRTASRSAGMSAPLAACIWRSGFRYKKAGVVCLDLHPAGRSKPDCFMRRTRRRARS